MKKELLRMNELEKYEVIKECKKQKVQRQDML